MTQHTPKQKPAAIRIDGGKRTDLAKQRRRREASTAARAGAPTVEDTRVADAWQREQSRAEHRRQTEPERKRTAKLLKQDGGKDGAVLSTVKILISRTRSEKRAIRALPGTFEWRYGRNVQDVHYHAGNQFALLWEKAGTAAAKSPDLSAFGGGAGWKGLPDSRAVAIQEINAAKADLGSFTMSRLIDYCVAGLTSAQIANKHGQDQRDIATVLHQDLRACAFHFRLLGNRR